MCLVMIDGGNASPTPVYIRSELGIVVNVPEITESVMKPAKSCEPCRIAVDVRDSFSGKTRTDLEVLKKRRECRRRSSKVLELALMSFLQHPIKHFILVKTRTETVQC